MSLWTGNASQSTQPQNKEAESNQAALSRTCRSSNDQGILDSELPFRCGSTLALGFQLIGIVVVTCTVTPSLVLVVLPLAVVYIQLGVSFVVSPLVFALGGFPIPPNSASSVVESELSCALQAQGSDFSY